MGMENGSTSTTKEQEAGRNLRAGTWTAERRRREEVDLDVVFSKATRCPRLLDSASSLARPPRKSELVEVDAARPWQFEVDGRAVK